MYKQLTESLFPQDLRKIKGRRNLTMTKVIKVNIRKATHKLLFACGGGSCAHLVRQ